MRPRNPRDEVISGNPWYTEDQFAKQYQRPGPRAVIENRWIVFEEAIASYIESSGRGSAQDAIQILDAGCGDGINLFGMSKMIRKKGWNASLNGVDYNELRVGRASTIPFVKEIVVSPLEALTFARGRFDIVLCNQVLEHIAQDKRVIAEIHRILRPGGILILGVPNEGCAMGRLRNKVLQRSILRMTDHVNFYTQKTVTGLLTTAGYSLRSIVCAGFLTPHSVLHYALSRFAQGRWLLRVLGRILPSQCAELIVVAGK